MEAPIPVMEISKKRPKMQSTNKYNIKKYILSLSKTDNNSVIFEAKMDADLITCYYELEYEFNNFPKLSELFSKYNNLDEVYQLLNDSFNKNEANISTKSNCIELSFLLDVSTNKQNEIKLYLDKKEINTSITFNKLNKKIDDIKAKQKSLEDKIEEIIKDINLIKDKQNNIEKEINLMKSIQSENTKTSKNLEDSYKKINNFTNKIFEKFEKIEKESSTYSEIEKKIEEINKRNDENKNIINNQKNILDELNNKISNCKNSLEEKSKNINEIKEKQIKMQKDIDSKKEKIESAIKLATSIKSENEKLSKKMEENEKKIQKLQMKLEKKRFKKGNKPTNYKLQKNISSDLFEKKNFYNQNSCIFNFYEDNNIYVVYGVKTFDLECYDIQNDKKFIIIKKLHKDSFYSCRHFFYKENIKDIIITSSLDRHVKVTNFKKEKSEVILDLNFDGNQKPINTVYFSNDYILVPLSDENEGSVQIYSMDSNMVVESEENCGFILGLTTYYWEKKGKNFIIVSNRKGIFSFIIDNFYRFQEYSPSENNEIMDENGFSEACIIEDKDNLIIVGSSFNQGLYLWDFINGKLISKMDIKGINNICLWNNDFILASVNKSELCEFILIDANNKKIEKKIGGGIIDQFGCGIQLLRNLSKGNFLISFSNKGELKLYALE